MSDHRVKVDNGKYEFIRREDGVIRIARNGELSPLTHSIHSAIHAAICELDAARVVVQAFRQLVAPGNDRLSTREGFNRITDALARHDALTSDREPPSAWCGAEQSAPAVVGPEKCHRCRAPDRPRNQYADEMALTEMCLELHQGADGDRQAELLAFLEYKLEHWTTSPSQSDGSAFDDAVRALVVSALAETPNGLHGDPSRAGGWIGPISACTCPGGGAGGHDPNCEWWR